jgi:hypothetical protein
MTCLVACSGNACVKPCLDGTTRCVDPTTQQTCANSIWGQDKVCAYGCSGTACAGAPAPSNPGSSRGGGSSSGGSNTGGGEVSKPAPCTGWTPPANDSVSPFTQTNEGGQTRNCNNITTISYCKLATGSTDTARTQKDWHVECGSWTDLKRKTVPVNVGAAPVSTPTPPAPAQSQDWLTSTLNQYGMWIAALVGILLLIGILVFFAFRGKPKDNIPGQTQG